MKKVVVILVFALMSSVMALSTAATIKSEVISINGVELRCDVSDFGVLQIRPAGSQLEEIRSSNNSATLVKLGDIKELSVYAYINESGR